MAEVNEAGRIALKYYQSQQVLAQRTASGEEYVFIPRANISMAWVLEQDAPELLTRNKVCCGGNKKKSFHEANESDVRRWTNGGGR